MLSVEQLKMAGTRVHAPRPLHARPIVVLGAGGIVQTAHLPAYRKAEFPVIGIADTTPGRAADVSTEWNISRSFDSVEEAIRFAPSDAVFDVAVPASQLLHVIPLLPASAAVLIQKPFGETLEEARALRDLCRRLGLQAAVNFQLRYAPNHMGAVALAEAGALGQLHEMEIQVRTYTPWHLWTFLATAPRLEILYHSIHYLDIVRAWMGNPLGVQARTTRHPESPQLAAVRAVITLDYGDDRHVLISTTHGHRFAATQTSFVQWEGTTGAIRMEMGVNLDYPVGKPDTLAFAQREDLTAGWQPVAVSGNWFPDAFMGSMGALQAYVEGTATDLPISFESAFETMALVEAAYRSSATRTEPLLF